MRSVAGTARSTGVIVGLTIAVLIGTAALLAITHSNSASRQQRLVVGSYEILSLMRQTVIALQDSEIGQRAYLLSGARWPGSILRPIRFRCGPPCTTTWAALPLISKAAAP